MYDNKRLTKFIGKIVKNDSKLDFEYKSLPQI